ncbi:hypothetical protein NDU88_000255 [Pleurodeles waltl]|uniref:Uncharacterized protein n=1 Tax=Pleurodeles waltl TaxID=8319 RepID=A0AAV7UQJ7_PLEWA|nr:hypothetical protein NDU88_000255 [Pleurodeles waltl]
MEDCSWFCVIRFRQHALAHTKLVDSGKWLCRGPGKTRWTTQEGEPEGALSDREPTEDQASHTRVPQDGDMKVAEEAHAALQERLPHGPRTTLGAVCRRIKCWGGLSFMMHVDLGGRMPTSLGSRKRHSALGYCLAWKGKVLTPPKLDSWKRGPSRPFQSTICDAGSTQLSRRVDPRSRSSSQLVPAEAGE